MTPEQIDHFKQLLLTRQNELRQASERDAEGRETVTLDQQSVGRVSRIDALQRQQIAQAQQRQRTNDLVQIEQALQRIADGEYGYCTECGEPIAIKRLEVDPAARLCIACARASH